VVPAPSAGGSTKNTDSHFAEIPATRGDFWFNSDVLCVWCDNVGATAAATRGKLKSVYR
jgi:hypothetical protein